MKKCWHVWALCLWLLLGITAAVEPAGSSASHGTLDAWNGKRAGMITGTFHEAVLRAEFPDSPITEYNNQRKRQ